MRRWTPSPGAFRFSWSGIFCVTAFTTIALRNPTRSRILIAAGMFAQIAPALHDLLWLTGYIPFTAVQWFPSSFPALFVVMGLVLADDIATTRRALREANTDLERKVIAAREELNQMYERQRLQDADRFKLEERGRLMREMHDGVGTHLSLLLSGLQRGKLRDEEVRDAVQLSMDELRLLLDARSPSTETLVEAISNLRHRLEPRLQLAGAATSWQVDDYAENAALSAEATPARAAHGAGMRHQCDPSWQGDAYRLPHLLSGRSSGPGSLHRNFRQWLRARRGLARDQGQRRRARQYPHPCLGPRRPVRAEANRQPDRRHHHIAGHFLPLGAGVLAAGGGGSGLRAGASNMVVKAVRAGGERGDVELGKYVLDDGRADLAARRSSQLAPSRLTSMRSAANRSPVATAESRSSVGTARSPSLFATVAFSTRRPSMRTLTATASRRKAVPNATISVDRQLIWSQCRAIASSLTAPPNRTRRCSGSSER